MLFLPFSFELLQSLPRVWATRLISPLSPHLHTPQTLVELLCCFISLSTLSCYSTDPGTMQNSTSVTWNCDHVSLRLPHKIVSSWGPGSPLTQFLSASPFHELTHKDEAQEGERREVERHPSIQVCLLMLVYTPWLPAFMTLLKREATQTLLLDHLFSNPTLSNSRPTVAGRRAVIGKRHVGTFWVDGNVLWNWVWVWVTQKVVT